MSPILPQIRRGSSGIIHLRILGEPFQIHAEDAALLAILGRKIPIYLKWTNSGELPCPAGFGCRDISGRAVQFVIRNETFHLPQDVFLSICLGEITVAWLEEVITDNDEKPVGGDPA
jgi:hypothetical protein